MAKITLDIKDEMVPFFIEAFKEDYDQRVENGELEGVTEAQYAKQNWFKFSAPIMLIKL